MTGTGRYLALFFEHFPSRHYEDPPSSVEREDLDFASDYPDEVAAIVNNTVDDYDAHDRWSTISYEIIDQQTEDRWLHVREFIRDT